MFREKWGGLHPLSRARRLQTLASLQPLAEMQVAPHLLLLSPFCSIFLGWTGCKALCAYDAAYVFLFFAVPDVLGSSIVVSPVILQEAKL